MFRYDVRKGGAFAPVSDYVECFALLNPAIDVETIAMAAHF